MEKNLSYEHPNKINLFSITSPTPFQFLWIGYFASLFGDHLNKVGLIWYVNQHFDSVNGGMSLGFSMAIPAAIVGVFAGVIVDRMNRTTLLFASDLIRAAILFVMIIVFLFFEPSLLVISVFSFLMGLVGLLFSPAMQSLLPDVANNEKERIVKMSSWMMVTRTTLSSVGPAMAGLLVPFISIEWVLGIDGVSFLLSFLLVLMMNKKLKKAGISTDVAAPKGKNVFASAKQGFQFIFKEKVLGPQFMIFPFLEAVNFAIPFFLPQLISENLNQTAEIFGLCLGVWMFGRVIGMYIFKKTSISEKRGLIFSSHLFVQILGIFMVVTAPHAAIMILGFLLLGIPSGMVMLALSTYVQTSVKNEFRGRVFATMSSMGMALVPLGVIVIGFMSKGIGLQNSFLSGCVLLFLCGLFVISRKAVREVQ